MEEMLSGYCRNIDGARIVLCDMDERQTEIDCDYECCAYRAECTIGKQIAQLIEQSKRK